MNKLYYVCTAKYYASVKKHEEDFYELIGSYFQEICLNKKQSAKQLIYSYLLCKKEGKIDKL